MPAPASMTDSPVNCPSAPTVALPSVVPALIVTASGLPLCKVTSMSDAATRATEPPVAVIDLPIESSLPTARNEPAVAMFPAPDKVIAFVEVPLIE